MVSSLGLLKLYVKFVSARNSPVNASVSSGEFFVRGLPESQLKSANPNGSGFLAAAAGVCTDWAGGDSMKQLATEVQKATGLSSNGSGTIIGAATVAYCPEFRSKM